ncbi:MAG: NlpC/P60 family protein [Maritimibacter sp.]
MSDPDGAALIAEARSWLGTPYVHQASRKGAGTDCLGLIRGLWRHQFGDEPQDLPAYTPDWGEPSGTETLLIGATGLMRPVDVAAVKLGDVIVFRMKTGAIAKHLGVVSALGAAPRFIHAFSGRGVVESPFSAPWQRRVAAYFRFPQRG